MENHKQTLLHIMNKVGKECENENLYQCRY